MAVTTWKPESSQYIIKPQLQPEKPGATWCPVQHSVGLSAALEHFGPLCRPTGSNHDMEKTTEPNKGSRIHDNSDEELFSSFWSLWSVHQCKDFHFAVN